MVQKNLERKRAKSKEGPRQILKILLSQTIIVSIVKVTVWEESMRLIVKISPTFWFQSIAFYEFNDVFRPNTVEWLLVNPSNGTNVKVIKF